MSNYLTNIVTNISKWDQAKSDFNVLISEMFTQNLSFNFSLNSDQLPINEDNVHCYLAINSDNKLQVYLVAESNDNENQEDWERVVAMSEVLVQEFPIDNSSDIGIIPPGEAYEISQNWNENYPTWTLNQSEKDDVFYALQIPGTDLKANIQYSAYFGLIENDEFDSKFYGTLVINTKIEERLISPQFNNISELFYNTVMPVPPYKPNGTEVYFLHKLAVESVVEHD
jgi:hypothetical protein